MSSINKSTISNDIYLRDMLEDDYLSVVDLLSNSSVMQYIGPRRSMNEDEIREWFDDFMIKQASEEYRKAVALKSTNELVGICGVRKIGKEIDFGYFFRKKFWRKGYAYTTCKKMLPGAYLKYGNNLIVFVAKNNLASANLLKKLGWEPQKIVTRNSEDGWIYKPKPHTKN